jgi:hypothetical protein
VVTESQEEENFSNVEEAMAAEGMIVVIIAVAEAVIKRKDTE